ncbi:CAMP factor family pore-forming toxin [Anaerococcus provencensis]|uniref:CAMP factor family pore-forming toxin n=1 Tax=Anaerococcus provencensis TaxID=938293 RepID=UPI0002E3A821|nr:CAMP factor family pore-forming toxin [Anaerococcus provencensis]
MKNKIFASVLAMLMLVNVGAPTIASASSESETSLMEEYQNTLPQLSESEMLEGATVLEENKVKNVPLMQAYQEDLITLAEDRGFDLPPVAQRYNPDTIYDLDSIAPRIKLLGLTGIFIHRCSTELIYKVQAAHSKAAGEVAIALVTAFNPFASIDEIEQACERISSVMDELVQMPDLTADDFATIYLKRVFNKDVREAKKLLNKYYIDDLSEVGVKGKREFIRNSLTKEINDVYKKGNSQIQVKDLIELDARLKSACQAALLERDVYASPKWLSGTIDKEIRDARNIKNKTSKYLTTDERNAFEKELRKANDVRRAKDVSYSRAAEGVYILRDYINELRAKHPQEFEAVLALREGEAISWREFNVQSEIPDPARIAKIIWLNSPSFDFLPDGFMPSDNEEIIVGYGNEEIQYGSYETYTINRDRLRASEEVVAPDFGDEGEENNQTLSEGYLIFDFN